MKTAIDYLLQHFAIEPVLVDVGASGEAVSAWQSVASRAFYVGFDPDSREMSDTCGRGFARSVIINQAVAATAGEASFYLTRSPQCSSTLLPDKEALADYLFSDLFEVEQRVSTKTTTLDLVLENLKLSRIDWLKIDTQGTDLRIFNSIDQSVRRSILCVDVEPGLIHAYQGEDLFVDTHRELMRQGFWLSNLNVRGNVRMKPKSAQAALQSDENLRHDVLMSKAGFAPGWAEARYLRSLDSLSADCSARDLVLLWGFSLLNGHFGHAFEVALFCENQLELKSSNGWTPVIIAMMKQQPLREIRKAQRQQRTHALLSPTRVMKKVRHLIAR